MAARLLLTGAPGCGKTTVVRRVVDSLRDLRLAGFLTQEVRGDDGRRTGFEAIGLSGGSATLAGVRSKSRLRVGKYGVELASFEQLVEAQLKRRAGDVDVFVIDEIGKMECLSPLFVKLVGNLLEGDAPLLATVALKGRGLIEDVKQRPGVELMTVTPANRDDLVAIVANRFRAGAAGDRA